MSSTRFFIGLVELLEPNGSMEFCHVDLCSPTSITRTDHLGTLAKFLEAVHGKDYKEIITYDPPPCVTITQGGKEVKYKFHRLSATKKEKLETEMERLLSRV